MPDLETSWSGDLSFSPSGDLTVVRDPLLGTERLLRRLLTNPGDYIWNPDYGAGLAQYVGLPIDVAGVEALIRTQMKLETAVSTTPEPVISVLSDIAGRLYVQIRYEDSVTGMPSTVNASLRG